MNCRGAKAKLFDLSSDAVAEDVAIALKQHFAECPECNDEWMLVQRTVTVLSTTQQPVVTGEQSQQMWLACSGRLAEKIEAQTQERQRQEARHPSFFNLRGALSSDQALLSPLSSRPAPALTWGFAALSVASLLFAASWLAPHSSSAPPERLASFTPQVEAPNFEALPGSEFGRLSSGERPLVNHHAAMSFDPFTDYVGSTLISYSATAPAISPNSSAAEVGR